ncbi:MAG TPA: hypothetical protein VGG94_00660 [Chthoniobacterales bacterium]
MNDFSDIEKELKKLRPLRPSPHLLAAIEKEIGEPQGAQPSAPASFRKYTILFPRFRFSLGLGLLAAAAAVVLLVVRVNLPTSFRAQPRVAAASPQPGAAPSGVPSSAQFIPAGATRVVYRTRNEGLLFPSGSDRPVRRVRSHGRETLQWHNPETGASLRVSYPSEEVRLIPVAGQ